MKKRGSIERKMRNKCDYVEDNLHFTWECAVELYLRHKLRRPSILNVLVCLYGRRSKCQYRPFFFVHLFNHTVGHIGTHTSINWKSLELWYILSNQHSIVQKVRMDVIEKIINIDILVWATRKNSKNQNKMKKPYALSSKK